MFDFFTGDLMKYLTREEREEFEELLRRYLELSPDDPQRALVGVLASEILEKARERVADMALKEIEGGEEAL